MISGRYNLGKNVEVGSYKLERMRNFKHSDVPINSTNNDREEIEIKTTAANECRCGLANIFKSKHESLKNNMISQAIIGSVPLYACGTWPMIKGDEKKTTILKTRILSRIYGSKNNVISLNVMKKEVVWNYVNCTSPVSEQYCDI